MGKTTPDLDDREDGIMILSQMFTCKKCGAVMADYTYPQTTSSGYGHTMICKCGTIMQVVPIAGAVTWVRS